jgi:hypothetical protein
VQKCTEIVDDVSNALPATDFGVDLTKFATSKILIHHFSDAGQKGQIVTNLIDFISNPFCIHFTFLGAEKAQISGEMHKNCYRCKQGIGCNRF